MNGDTAEENTPRLHPLTRCPQRPDAFCKKAHSGNFPFELQLCNFAVDIKEARKFSLHSPNVHGSFEVMRTGQEEFSINFCNLFKKDTIFPIYRFLELCLWQIPIKLNGWRIEHSLWASAAKKPWMVRVLIVTFIMFLGLFRKWNES